MNNISKSNVGIIVGSYGVSSVEYIESQLKLKNRRSNILRSSGEMIVRVYGKISLI